MTRKSELPTYIGLEEAAEIMSLSTRTIRRRISDDHCKTEAVSPSTLRSS